MTTQISKTDAQITKMAVDIMKSSNDIHEADLELFHLGLDAFKKSNPGKSINDFTDTGAGLSLKERVAKSRERLTNGPVDVFTKALDDAAAAVDADIAKQVESFALAHNADPIVAKRRLEAISPRFVALVKRQAEIPNERREQVKKCQIFAERWRQREVEKATEAELADAAEQSEKRRTKALSPSERKFDERVGQIMKERRLARPAATNWAIANDATARALYEVSREERTNGARS